MRWCVQRGGGVWRVVVCAKWWSVEGGGVAPEDGRSNCWTMKRGVSVCGDGGGGGGGGGVAR